MNYTLESVRSFFPGLIISTNNINLTEYNYIITEVRFNSLAKYYEIHVKWDSASSDTYGLFPSTILTGYYIDVDLVRHLNSGDLILKTTEFYKNEISKIIEE